MLNRDFAFLATTTFRKSHSRQCSHQLHSCIFRASYSTRLSANARDLVLSPDAPDLVQWIRDEGGFVHEGLKLESEGSSGLGLVSSKAISAGTKIISLPRHIPLALPPLDAGLNQTDAILLRVAEVVPKELWTLKLALKLLGERAKVDSFWWPYISNLPKTFNLPIFFSEEEVQSLQYIPLIHQVKKRCKYLFNFEGLVNSVVDGLAPEQHPFGGQHVDAAALGWAMSAVSSRAFRLHGDITSEGKRGGTPMLLPLVDMCNHNFHPNARIIQETDGGCDKGFVKVVTEEQIQEHAPILLNYGPLTNDLLLIDYGFVVSKNQHDYVELKYDRALLDAAAVAAGVHSDTFASPARWQQEILLKVQDDWAIQKVTLGGVDLVDGHLLATLRVLFAENLESIEKHDLINLQSLAMEAPLGAANESNVLRTIIALCAIALGHFPTKIMEDEMLLRKEGNSEAMKLALEYRIKKKETLIDVMRDLTRRLNNVKRIKGKDIAEAD